MVEHSAVNRGVVGSSPTRGAQERSEIVQTVFRTNSFFRSLHGPVVKRLRHRPFTAVTRVRFSSGSLDLRRCERSHLFLVFTFFSCNDCFY